MARSRLIRSQIFDFVEAAIASETPVTDEALIERFDLSGVEAARGYLADLADDGRISIRGTGPDRVIGLGRQRPLPPPPPRPTRTITKQLLPDYKRKLPTAAEVTARIKMIRQAGGEPLAAAPPQIEVSAVAPEERNTGWRDRPKPDVELEVTVTEVPAVPPPPAPPQPVGRTINESKHLVTVAVPISLFRVLAYRAEKLGKKPGTLACDLVCAALVPTMPDPQAALPAPRPLIRGEITKAAVAAGFPVLDFVHRLIEVGFAAHLHDSDDAPAADAAQPRKDD